MIFFCKKNEELIIICDEDSRINDTFNWETTNNKRQRIPKGQSKRTIQRNRQQRVHKTNKKHKKHMKMCVGHH